MITESKNKKQTSRKRITKSIVSKNVKDYGNDPFFIKKANDSQKFLEKHGFPDTPNKK